MWKAPYRPSNEISQSYNDGVVVIHSVTDTAAPGYLPVEKLEPVIRLDYAELRTGLQRYYNAMQNQIQVERVLRVQRPPIRISTQDVAITEDGRQYGIGQIQTTEGVYPPSLDLTLTAIEQKYEVKDAADMA